MVCGRCGWRFWRAGLRLADANKQTKGNFDDKFRQLEVDLPTPNTYRTASGAPGESYWQQQADYVINATLDEATKRITATRDDHLQEQLAASAELYLAAARPEHLQAGLGLAADRRGRRRCRAGANDALSIGAAAAAAVLRGDAARVRDPVGDGRLGQRALRYTINDTMMRVDLPRPLAPRRDDDVQDRLGVQHRRQQSVRRPRGLRAFPRQRHVHRSSRRSGSRGWRPTPTTRAGSTSSSSARASSRSSSATTMCRSPCRPITSWPRRACCRTRTRC